jgi:hypothetical protein
MIALKLACLIIISTYWPLTAFAISDNGRKASACSENVLEAEKLLLSQGYLPGSIDGCLDEATSYALLAFRRAHRLRVDEGFTSSLLQTLRTSKPFRPRSRSAPHLEIDLSRQIMYWVKPDGTVNNILPVSIGSGKSYIFEGQVQSAITPRGNFFVYRKIESWRHSPLGSMYYPSYIKGGIAIHGSPNFSKSSRTYGCIAIPLYAAVQVYDLLSLGSKVIIYGKAAYVKSKTQSRKIINGVGSWSGT